MWFTRHHSDIVAKVRGDDKYSTNESMNNDAAINAENSKKRTASRAELDPILITSGNRYLLTNPRAKSVAILMGRRVSTSEVCFNSAARSQRLRFV